MGDPLRRLTFALVNHAKVPLYKQNSTEVDSDASISISPPLLNTYVFAKVIDIINLLCCHHAAKKKKS